MAERVFTSIEELSRSTKSKEVPRYTIGGRRPDPKELRPRHMWRKAVVYGLLEGRDHKVRTVMLRTSEGGKFSRPVQLVFPLEVDQGGEDVKE